MTMLKSLEKLIKIFSLEAQSGYGNKAIIGGMDKFYPNWLIEAKNDPIDPDILAKIDHTFSTYAQMSISEREESIKEIVSAIKELPDNSLEPVNSSRASNSSTTSTPYFHKSLNPSSNPHHKEDKPRYQGGLLAPVTVLPGIGEVKKETFHTLGVDRVQDLLYYFPRRYVDYSTLKTINRLEFGDELTIVATVQSLLTTPIRRRNQARVEVVVSDGTGFLRLVFFRSLKYIQSFENHFRRGTQLVISGKVTMYLGRKQMNDPAFEPLDQSHLNTNRITPVYPLTAGLTQKDLRASISAALLINTPRVEDHLPDSMREQIGLISLSDSLQQVHFPDNFERLRQAQDRLAFDEIFFLQLGVQQQKQSWQGLPAKKYEITDEQIRAITLHLPFALTHAQERVIAEIRSDLASGKPMNRLIQGDVGSGKTILAAIASAAVNLNDGQTAFMAPTSILAEQHFSSLRVILSGGEDTGLPLHESEIRLLTGDTSAREREEISTGCQDGTVKLLLGTHALIEDTVNFKNLQLAIIDEQHRFGISQRSALRQKGENPHLLVMSATPIPRSLALTIFGDLDISVLDEMPPGRKPVDTQIIHPFAREKAYQLIQNEIKNGHQAFIIYPLIDKGDDEDKKAAVDEHAYLEKEIFPSLKLGLLHGRMPADEKDRIMQAFRLGKYDILVSTTVIEVGVDIPNATVMMIEGANRFGLAQLHQLRGRVGRGQDKAYCLLVPENEDALENERLAVMTETTDGFVLAEKDLAQRGPGDFIGYRQSGYADLRMASLTDIHLIEKARHYAQEILKDDPSLEKPEHLLISTKLQQLWSSSAGDLS
ncbi:MAG: ATP-dependent DNA helicase RecG [Anaerolineaceae bacterium]